MGVAEDTRRFGRTVPVAILVAILTTSGQLSALGTVEESSLTAAFLFNFTRFTAWPADVLPSGAPLLLCVSDDGAVAEALEQTVKGRQVEGHQLTVKLVDGRDDVAACHVLFIGGRDVERACGVIARLRDAPVFTVGRASYFAARGGVGELIVERDRMRFAINLTSAQRAHLRLSSRLLNLAEIVKD